MYFLSNNNCIFSDLQAFDDLLMHTSGNNEHYEHELEYNKRCITQLLFLLSGLNIFDVHFKLHIMSQRHPKIFLFFVYAMLCH